MTKFEFPKVASLMLALGGVAAAASFVAPALSQSLPNGKGKELVETICSGCHDLSPITESGFSREDWGAVIQSMVAMGAVIKPDDATQMVDYLAVNFPPKPKQ